MAKGVIPDVPVMFLADVIGGADFIIPVNVVAGGGSGGTASNFGAAFPGTGTAAGAKDNSGNMAGLNLDASGNLKIAGSFSSTPPSSNTSNSVSQQTVSTSSVQILAANASRKGCRVHNTGTTIIKLGLGQTPTQIAYHYSLRAGSVADDGSSEPWDGTISGVVWTGVVNAISSASGGTLVVTELTCTSTAAKQLVFLGNQASAPGQVTVSYIMWNYTLTGVANNNASSSWSLASAAENAAIKAGNFVETRRSQTFPITASQGQIDQWAQNDWLATQNAIAATFAPGANVGCYCDPVGCGC